MNNNYALRPHPELVEPHSEFVEPHSEFVEPHPELVEPHPELVEGSAAAAPSPHRVWGGNAVSWRPRPSTSPARGRGGTVQRRRGADRAELWPILRQAQDEVRQAQDEASVVNIKFIAILSSGSHQA